MPSAPLSAERGETHAAPPAAHLKQASTRALDFPALARLRFLREADDQIRLPP